MFPEAGQRQLSEILHNAFELLARTFAPCRYAFFAPSKMPPDALKQVSLKLATAMVDLYAAVKERFTVDDREHYVRTSPPQPRTEEHF